MSLKHLLVVALAGCAIAQEGSQSQSLNATLFGNSQLSNLTQLLSADPALINTLSQARNITILAPSNEAFARAAQNPAFAAVASDPQVLASVLLYHVLNGTIQAEDITNSSTFVHTYLARNALTNGANVTNGQVVEAVVQGNQTSFFSGLQSRANVTQAVSLTITLELIVTTNNHHQDVNFTGGVIHIIDSVLSPPVDVLETASAFK